MDSSCPETKLDSTELRENRSQNVNARKLMRADIPSTEQCHINHPTLTLMPWKADQDAILKKLIDDVAELKLQNESIKSSNAEMVKSIHSMNNNYEEVSQQIELFEKDLNECIVGLEMKIQDSQRISRSSSLETKEMPDNEKKITTDLEFVVTDINLIDAGVAPKAARDDCHSPEKGRFNKSIDVESYTKSEGTEVELSDVLKNGKNGGVITHEYIEHEPSGWFETTLTRVGNSTDDFFKNNGSAMKVVIMFVINGIVIGYFFGCLYYWLNYSTDPLELCHGFGSLIAFLSIIYFFIIYFTVIKRLFGEWFGKHIWSRIEDVCTKLWSVICFRWIFCLVVLGLIGLYLYLDARHDPERLISLLGLGILLLLGFVFSAHPGRINWRTVSIGLLIQFVFGILFIRWTPGRVALQCFSDKVATFLSYGVDGAAFAFGDLLVRTEGVFAFSTLPVIFFFSMLVEILFFWGALQWFCLKLGMVLQAATGTTVCESVIAVGNVFLGMTESILLVKPYLSLQTPSELHVVMASGFATVSGTILASYIGFGAEPAHLVTASVMSAPAAICYSKLLMPETKRSLTTVDNMKPVQSEDQSVLSAATRGATNGISLILNIIANIIAFVAFIAFINGFLGYCGGLLGNPDINLEWILGKVFIPLSWVMGVPWEECELVGSLIGLKTVVNEFVAYQRMGEMKKEGLLSPRAELIATYSLCGFTNPASAGIMIGAMAAIAPDQREVLSSIAVRAFFAGCGICFMTACIAGLLMPENAFV